MFVFAAVPGSMPCPAICNTLVNGPEPAVGKVSFGNVLESAVLVLLCIVPDAAAGAPLPDWVINAPVWVASLSSDSAVTM